jgi:hypothetical protein
MPDLFPIAGGSSSSYTLAAAALGLTALVAGAFVGRALSGTGASSDPAPSPQTTMQGFRTAHEDVSSARPLPAVGAGREAAASGLPGFNNNKSAAGARIWDPAGLTNQNTLRNLRSAQIKHGRIAMMATAAAEIGAEADPTQVGNTKPMGFFDPLGFSKQPFMVFDNDPTGFKFLRSAEMKNGRVAMMASVGLVVQHYVKFPGFEDVPAGLGALTTSQGANGFMALIFLVGVLFESNEYRDGTFATSMGNYGDPLNLGNYNKEYQNKEINNCRMAMIAVLGQLVAEIATGKDAVEQFSGEGSVFF